MTWVIKAVYSQDPEFTQFYANPLYLNPGFAGTHKCSRVVMNYRNQWPALSGTFSTYSVSYDHHLEGIGGIGLLATMDNAGRGTLTTTNLSGIYSYHLTVSRFFSITTGVQATYMQKVVDWNKLNFGDMIDPRSGFVLPTAENLSYPGKHSNVDFSVGILGYSKRLYGGLAVNHLFEPDEYLMIGPSPLPRKYTAHMGAVLPVDNYGGESTSISPNVLFQLQQDFVQLNLGIYINKGPLVGGLWYRNQDAFIVLLGVEKGIVKVGYSYDMTVSKLANATAGSHEISFAIQANCKPKKRRFRTISCPSF